MYAGLCRVVWMLTASQWTIPANLLRLGQVRQQGVWRRFRGHS